MNNNVFDNLISLKEASDKWKIDDSVLRRAILNGHFKQGYDVKKFGKQWVILIDAMNREYGQIEPTHNEMNYSNNKKKQIYYYESELLLAYAKKRRISIKKASVLFNKMNIFKMIYDCYDYLHLGNANDVVTDISRRIKKRIIYGR